MKYKLIDRKLTRQLANVLLAITLLVGTAWTGYGTPGQKDLPNNSETQQGMVISGKITSGADKSVLPGATVVVKGTTNGVVSDFNGNYTITVPNAQSVLVISFVGMQTQEIAVNGKTAINVILAPATVEVGEVVVTALGIKREEKSLGFSIGKVNGEELTRVVQENLLNSLAGKVSGVTINSTGGTGSSVSMVIRGATSMTTDNQPLFVVDGVPMSNTVNNIGGFGYDNRVDYGNAISDLDPESIENITILKGPSAAALYGTRAGNGVVLVTTKKAKGKDGMKVSVTSNTVFDIPARFLNIQNKFATGGFSYRPEDTGGILPPINYDQPAGAGPELDKGYWAVQWDGPKDANGVPVPTELVSYPNNFRNFINDYALTTTNGASVSSSNATSNYRIGMTNMTHNGIVPNSDLNKNNFSLSASSKVRKNLTISTDINFANNWAKNRPATNVGANPLQWAYSSPAEIDIRRLKDYGSGSDVKRIGLQYDNPYFIANEINNSFNRYHLSGNIVANWEISPSFNIMGRYALNKTDEVRETKMAPGGYSKEPNNGAYGIVTSNGLERNMDMLATYTKNWTDFSLKASVGGNLLYTKGSSISNSSKPGVGLITPNVFTIQNISSGALAYYNGRSQKSINSVYGMANLGWKDIAYLDLTARNDWSSTLPAANRSYFYPSTSLSIMADKLFNLGPQVNMLKIRGGWAQVGNDTSPYQLTSTYYDAGQWGDAARLGKPGGLQSPNLLPEQATSYEIGTDLKMYNNRLRFEATYYQKENRNQILGVPLAASTGFSGVLINAGLLESKGVELLLGVTPIKKKDWVWDLNLNFTKNETRILELTENVEFIEFWEGSKVKNIGYVKDATHDGLVGNLYARKIKRVTDKSSQYYGFPIIGYGFDAEWEGEEEYSKVGNYNPKFIMGLQSALTYKNFTLNMTFDWRSGGQYISQTYTYFSEGVITQTWLDQLVNPGALGGELSPALRDWVLANKDELLLGNRLRPVGGPTPAYGGFPETFSGYTVHDGTFAPGVQGHYDTNGKFILEQENLGNVGTTIVPYVGSWPWDIGEASLLDADYVKLREISLSYKLPGRISQKMGMEDVNFSVYSRNIMLWTKASGFGIDPERAYEAEGSTFRQGIERYNAEPGFVPIGFKVGFTF
jgi:TonB-linked SusC/RagA family outer membrane protein